MEEYLIITMRTLFFYVLIIAIFRLMGKREIGELSVLDLVVFIMIAELAVVGIENGAETKILHTLLPMGILMLVQIVLAQISLKSKRFRDLVDGQPIVIINRGKIDEHAMRQQRYNFDDLLLQLREKDIRNIADVEFAILEASGKLSVFEKKHRDIEPRGDMTIPLIIDGEIQEGNLERVHKTNLGLRQDLRERGYRDIKQISFCSFEHGKYFIDLKDEK
ncbi:MULTISPECIES: DUF421 domain-containing protein [unclassified Bacillus (in: firmicutes)]|uniref:DUF421 domain-containing protein n=1 Tax=unclassified Bacillus (in: firmicutes) TaxID=185979 RepID=UPI0008E22A59|nr:MULTISPECIES: DUF421 domain-containing protein [unclassified Bacillus (in: firmicutes)]SFA94597.1 Uncharacterized membrane protein YcaP, DUF421 family [Bacillus sp. UNCCL13]SFQ78514.1 Uncharacterized membrane protein YcaP, DUF421 family [Bacillus sp. cl95]